MLGKFMDFCFTLDRDHYPLGMLSFIFGMTFAIVLLSVIIVGSAYKLSGASERDRQSNIACKEAGGELIYIKGTGYRCIKGIIKLN